MIATRWDNLEIPGRVTFLDGNGDLPKIEVTAGSSIAEIYLHGAHVTNFQCQGEPPILFQSQLSRFEQGSPIRGGIPVIFPWFGPREACATHGFARTKTWDLREIIPLPGGAVSLRFTLPDSPEAALLPGFAAEYVVTVGQALAAGLIVTNVSPDAPFTFENCLHSYFTVGDIDDVSVTGLKGADYLDKVENFARKTETSDAIRITGETDRIYLHTTSAVEIHDSRLGRKIIVEKSGSNSTVVWNPWIARAQQMPDLGNDEYRNMICVESGNVDQDRITLGPGATAKLFVKISAVAL